MAKFLFTTLPTNDLGLLTRSLPIARELKKSGHKIVYCSPSKAPTKLIHEAGFKNLVPKHPFYQVRGFNLKTLNHLFRSKRYRLEYGSTFQMLLTLAQAIPTRFAPMEIAFSLTACVKSFLDNRAVSFIVFGR